MPGIYYFKSKESARYKGGNAAYSRAAKLIKLLKKDKSIKEVKWETTTEGDELIKFE